MVLTDLKALFLLDMKILFWMSTLLLFYSYLFYPLLVTIWANLLPNRRQRDDTLMPSITMLVSAYNEEEHIADKIDNFRNLDYPDELKELLIGSDGSSDRTNEIITSAAEGNIRCFCYDSRSGKAAVLNRLVKEAKGEILVFSDANTMYQPDAIKKLVRHFADEKTGGVNGRLYLINPGENKTSQGEQAYWTYENLLKKAEGRIRTVLGANGGIYAMRKELFVPLPEDKVIVDDFLVALNAVKQGYDVIYDEEARATETTSPHLKGEFARKVRIGAGNFNILPEIKSLLNPRQGFVAFALWSHKLIRWFAPFLLLTILLTNLMLLSESFYRMVFILQVLFYGLALAGHFLSRRGNVSKIWLYPLYFTATNLALGIGFFKAITKKQKPAWASVERG